MKRNSHETQSETQQIELLETEPVNNVLNFSSTLAELRRNVDPHLVRQRAGRRDRNGNVHMVEYVEWHTVADILDRHASNWAHEIKDIKPIGDIITVTVAITIDGVTREGIGTGKTASETGIKKAEHDALKRAAVKFGIARELYKKEFDSIDHDDHTAEVEPRQRIAPVEAVARNLGDMVTAKQLNMIRAIAREKEIDAEGVCGEMFACRIEEISKRAASDLIDRLQEIQRPAVPMRRAG
ncbi:MAG: hypothetical protein JO314_02180 [Acidobacteria bacterium]|nr:hypothetical protein [Acidobacteriota bacterium]